MCRCLCGHVFRAFENIPASTMHVWYGECRLRFLRNNQAAFPHGCEVSHAHRQGVGVPLAPRVPRHLVVSLFCMWASPIGMSWHLIVV